MPRKLQLRINDDIFFDNRGALTVSVSGPSVVPEPVFLALLGVGIGTLLITRRRARFN